MVWHLFPGRFGDEASFLSRLRRLADMAPAVMVLEGAPEEGVHDDLKESGGVNNTEVWDTWRPVCLCSYEYYSSI